MNVIRQPLMIFFVIVMVGVGFVAYRVVDFFLPPFSDEIAVGINMGMDASEPVDVDTEFSERSGLLAAVNYAKMVEAGTPETEAKLVVTSRETGAVVQEQVWTDTYLVAGQVVNLDAEHWPDGEYELQLVRDGAVAASLIIRLL